MSELLCLMFHRWWDRWHEVYSIDCGMGQMLYCRKYHCWRSR